MSITPNIQLFNRRFPNAGGFLTYYSRMQIKFKYSESSTTTNNRVSTVVFSFLPHKICYTESERKTLRALISD